MRREPTAAVRRLSEPRAFLTTWTQSGTLVLRAVVGIRRSSADKIKALAAALFRHASLSQIEEINGILNRIAAMAKADGHRIVDASAARIAAAGGPRA
jgi:hypothetical protein